MENLQGSIDLLQLNMAHVREVKGREKTLKCIVIPIDENGMYVKYDTNTLKPTQIKVSIDVLKRQQVGTYGDTHYAKLHVGNEFMQKFGKEITDELRSRYIGDFKPLVFTNDSSAVSAPDIDEVPEGNVELPF